MHGTCSVRPVSRLALLPEQEAIKRVSGFDPQWQSLYDEAGAEYAGAISRVFKRVYWVTEGRVNKESCQPWFTPPRYLAFCILACNSQGFANRQPHKGQPQLGIPYTSGVCFDTS